MLAHLRPRDTPDKGNEFRHSTTMKGHLMPDSRVRESIPHRAAATLALAAAIGATGYHVGPGQPLSSIGDAPLATLEAGDTVYIHARQTPYREKFVLAVEGTESSPIVVRGIPDPVDGSLPRLRGDGATTPDPLDFWSETRGIVKFGGSNTPGAVPKFVRLENLDISGARSANSFTDDKGSTAKYDANAAGIFVESGEHIQIRGCHLHDNGNGLFVAWQAKDVLVEGNRIRDNGNVGSVYEHNSYTEADGIVFQFNEYGALCQGCSGNNLKDRSAGTVIRYNRIDGGNRQLDLVESDHDEILARASYRRTFVYGNLLVERDGSGNRQMVHYGGDNGDTATYRHGVLHFYHNTLWSDRTDRNTLVRLSSTRDTADIRWNVLATKAPGSSLEILAGEGVASLRTNWLPSGWIKSFDLAGTVTESGTNKTGSDPGFADLAKEDFRVAIGSPLRATVGPLAADAANHLPTLALVGSSPLSWTTRGDFGVQGAFASVDGTGTVPVRHKDRFPSADFILRGGIRFRSGSGPVDALGRDPAIDR